MPANRKRINALVGATPPIRRAVSSDMRGHFESIIMQLTYYIMPFFVLFLPVFCLADHSLPLDRLARSLRLGRGCSAEQRHSATRRVPIRSPLIVLDIV